MEHFEDLHKYEQLCASVPWMAEELKQFVVAPETYEDTPCWLWTGRIDSSTGHGRVIFNGHEPAAHRAVYESLIGPMPSQYILKHKCLRPNCVNPLHLEPHHAFRPESETKDCPRSDVQGSASDGPNPTETGRPREDYLRLCGNGAGSEGHSGTDQSVCEQGNADGIELVSRRTEWWVVSMVCLLLFGAIAVLWRIGK